MERNEELRNEDARIAGRESERASELRDNELQRADEGEGFTHSDSIVRDDSLVAGTGSASLADRTDRTNRNVEDLEMPLANARERVAADNVVHHDDHPTVGDQVGEAAGGISGVIAGAAIGSLGGPIGTVIGGIAGAIGGWWAGRAISEAASNFSHADDAHFRSDYERRADEVSSRSRTYEAVRPAYQLGYLASRNPDYAGRSFDEIEPDLQRGWSSDASNAADWVEMRDYARTAYVRGAASQSSLTGDSSKKGDLTSTGTTGSVGTGSDAMNGSPIGTVGTIDSVSSFGTGRVASGNVSTVIDNGGALAGTSDVTAAQDAAARVQRPEIGPASSGGAFDLGGGASSSTRDTSYPGANPQGSMTYQSGERLTSSAGDSAGGHRAEPYDDVGERQRELRANDSGERPGYTDPVAGEGVENIASSGDSPRGDVSEPQPTLNDTPRDEEMRDEGEDRAHRY